MDWKKLAWVLVPALGIMLIVFAVLSRLVEPLPPRRITISTGRENGAYYLFGKAYAKLAAADGFTVDVMTGAGTVETLKRLAAGQAMAGFVQGGTAEAAPTEGLLSLGSLYYEPIWRFPPTRSSSCRCTRSRGAISGRGRRCSSGTCRSGLR